MTPQEQVDLETIILEIDDIRRRILIGTSSLTEGVVMKAKMLIGKYLPSYSIDTKQVFNIPLLKWVQKGFEFNNNVYKPLELEIAVDEKLKTIFRTAIENRATDISIESSMTKTEVFLTIDKERVPFKNVEFTPTEAYEVSTWIVTNSGIGQTLAQQRIVDCALPTLGDINTHRARVNKMTSYYGVVINMRILPNNPDFIDLETLNYSKFIHDYIKYLTKPRKGLVLFVGPTNSGKNTSVFSVLSEMLKKYRLKTISLEQPVEYLVPGVQQINASNDEEYNDISRALVRQSPDIIYLSEIRDRTTMDTALSISNTGKFVLSTLHVSHAYEVFNRAEDLYGKDISSKLTSELIGVVNQMLLPKACPDCLTEIPLKSIEEKYRKLLTDQNYNGNVYDNTGKLEDGTTCPNCKGEGYKGIIPVAEYINFDTTLKRKLRRCSSSAEKEEILQETMIKNKNSILADGLRNMLTKKVSISTLIEKAILDEDYA